MAKEESQDALDSYLSDEELYGADMAEFMQDFNSSTINDELDKSFARITELNKIINN